MKKIFFICISVAMIAMMGACNKECVCKRSTSPVANADTTGIVDTLTAKVDAAEVTYHAGHIYDKKECEYLNVSDTTTQSVVTLTCSMEKIEKK